MGGGRAELRDRRQKPLHGVHCSDLCGTSGEILDDPRRLVSCRLTFCPEARCNGTRSSRARCPLSILRHRRRAFQANI